MNNENQNWSVLADFGARMLSGISISAQSNLILDLLRKLCGCEPYVYVDHISHIGAESPELSKEFPPEVERVARTSIKKRTTIHREISPDQGTKSASLRKGVHILATPLILEGNLFGVCVLTRELSSPFSREEIQYFEFITSYIAITFLATSKSFVSNNMTKLLTLVKDISEKITQNDDLDELSSHITTLVQEAFNYYYVAIFTLSPDKKSLNFRNSAGPIANKSGILNNETDVDSLYNPSPRIDVQIGEGIIGEVAQTGERIIANDVSSNPYYRFEDVLPETKSEAAIPIKIGENVLGVLDVQSNKLDAFTDMDLIVLKALSDNIAVSIENSMLYSSLQKRINHLRSIYDVGNAITSILNFDDLLEKILDLIQVRLGYSRVHFFTVNPSNNDIRYQRGRSGLDKSVSNVQVIVNREKDAVSRVAQNKLPLIIDDYSEENTLSPIGVDKYFVRSELVVPLIFAGEVLGILDIQSDIANIFTDDDLFIVEALADNIAVALRNSNLYRSEQWRRQIADSLTEVAGLLSADVSLNHVLESILRELVNTLPSAAAAIWLLDDNYDTDESYPELRIAAIDGLSKSISDEESASQLHETILGYSLSDVIEYYGLERSVSTWLMAAVKSDVPIIRSPEMAFDPLGAILDLDENHSAISAPLKIADKPLGILSLVHEQPGKYGKNSQILSSTFANYAAVAIENARLYETAHDQAWVSTVLLQVAEATQSIDSLDELLQTIVHVLPELVGTQSCAILLWDEYIESFVPSIAYGFDPQQFEEFENWYVSESDVPAFENLRKSKSPVFLDQNTTSGEFGDAIFSSFDFSTGLYVLFPMITQNEVMGAILVNFREDIENFSGEVSLWEEKISIIQGIANQTAIAVDNIQLIKSQEEEAYVSIALLQVAQAVVNSNNLEDILAAIVRITPILVGVRRSVIFLWDEDQMIYRASQAYGFSREEISLMQTFYSRDEFTLLDVVRNNNTLTYYPIPASMEPFQWNEINQSNLSLVEKYSGNIRDVSLPQDLLNNKFPLLMGFPLAIKGKVLGIMLVEEADGRSQIPSVRIREKRLEIITGITQQAAVAIQNDILQRDVLERERLEREMQLARDIQSAFLPDNLPEINGWDIDVRWRPARQVGGDFYDIFDLPDNRLGIVIADVADKGMPAALYMTLVRTLIRAVVQENISPREVLGRVNNLLVPDSRQGMFVTLTYAVLSLDTGKMVIANAGHNPPISYNKSTREITEHNRTAMALGVFHDIEIKEYTLELEPDDFILFYTDGITEAFSSNEEIFGLQRLKDIILGPDISTAKSLLEQVDAAVGIFSEGISQSDDITLVALFHITD